MFIVTVVGLALLLFVPLQLRKEYPPEGLACSVTLVPEVYLPGSLEQFGEVWTSIEPDPLETPVDKL